MGALVPLLEPRHPLCFLRAGDGVIGFGEALRLEFRGADRIAQAADAWRAVQADVDDTVDVPGSGLIAFGSFTFAPDSEQASVLIVPQVVVGRRNGVTFMTTVDGGHRDLVAARPGPEYRARMLHGQMTRSVFTAAVATAVRRIQDSDLRKVVLARDLIGRIAADADLRNALEHLTRAYARTFTYAVEGLIGSSPELLVGSEDGTVTARVLAGSAARGDDATEDAGSADGLVHSPKDLEEHEFALDSVIGALRPHTSALSSSAAAYALKLPNLWHLASDVTGTLADGSSSLDLVAALHPTAAVAGSPTDLATDLIRELEPFDRGRYAGPVGWVDAAGDGEWAIALRCAQVSPDGMVHAYAGAGIVGGSDPEQELAETALKFKPIVEAFG
ncbi:MAG TPA: isochorismate synthase [Rhodoglobus sp.]|nr:isochorismate synthase [Rhodoglobus sp.]